MGDCQSRTVKNKKDKKDKSKGKEGKHKNKQRKSAQKRRDSKQKDSVRKYTSNDHKDKGGTGSALHDRDGSLQKKIPDYVRRPSERSEKIGRNDEQQFVSDGRMNSEIKSKKHQQEEGKTPKSQISSGYPQNAKANQHSKPSDQNHQKAKGLNVENIATYETLPQNLKSPQELQENQMPGPSVIIRRGKDRLGSRNSTAKHSKGLDPINQDTFSQNKVSGSGNNYSKMFPNDKEPSIMSEAPFPEKIKDMLITSDIFQPTLTNEEQQIKNKSKIKTQMVDNKDYTDNSFGKRSKQQSKINKQKSSVLQNYNGQVNRSTDSKAFIKIEESKLTPDRKDNLRSSNSISMIDKQLIPNEEGGVSLVFDWKDSLLVYK